MRENSSALSNINPQHPAKFAANSYVVTQSCLLVSLQVITELSILDLKSRNTLATSNRVINTSCSLCSCLPSCSNSSISLLPFLAAFLGDLGRTLSHSVMRADSGIVSVSVPLHFDLACDLKPLSMVSPLIVFSSVNGLNSHRLHGMDVCILTNYIEDIFYTLNLIVSKLNVASCM